MLVAGRFLSNGWRKSVTLRVKSVKDYHQTLQTPQYQLLKEIMATYVCCVMLRLNIQTTSVGIKSYVKKVKSHCLPVMYATSNSNLNTNWRGTSKFIPELFLFPTSAQRVSRGKTT